jgi:hypothetical protein
MKSKKNFLFTLVIAFIGLAHADAQQVSRPRPGGTGSWHFLGKTSANHSVDHDKIIVSGPFDAFRKLKFKVTDAPLHMIRMVVVYENGLPDNIDLRFKIPKGGESRLIDLKGGKRRLKSVDFWYETKGFLSGKADVWLYGMK